MEARGVHESRLALVLLLLVIVAFGALTGKLRAPNPEQYRPRLAALAEMESEGTSAAMSDQRRVRDISLQLLRDGAGDCDRAGRTRRINDDVLRQIEYALDHNREARLQGARR